jgi:putative ABC transport system substrate-binding protein
MGADPVLAGVAESWAHPGGNVTGVSLIAPELEIKRLSLLREVLPSVHRIAVLSNHRKVVEAGLLPLRKAAAEVGLELVIGISCEPLAATPRPTHGAQRRD